MWEAYGIVPILETAKERDHSNLQYVLVLVAISDWQRKRHPNHKRYLAMDGRQQQARADQDAKMGDHAANS